MEQSATPPRVKGKGKAAGTTPKGLGLAEGHEHKAICARALFQADTAGSVATAHIAATPVAPAAAPAAAATAGQAEQQQQQKQQQQQQQAALGLLAAALGPLHAFATQLQPQQAVGLVAALNPLVTTAVAALGTWLGGVPQVLPAAGLQLPALGGVPLPPPLPGQLLAALGGQLLLQLAGVPSVPSSVPLPALGGHEDGSPPWPDVLADANLRPGDTPTTSSQAQALVTMTSADAAVVWQHRRAEFTAESQRTRRPVGLAADDVVTGSVPPGELHLVYHVILSRRGGSSEHRLGDMCWSRKGAKQLTAWCKPWGDTNAVRITEEDDEAPCHVQPTGQPAPGFGVPRILRLPTDYDLTELKKSHHVWRLEATYKDDRDWPEPLPEYRAKFAPTASGDSMGNYKIKPQKLDPSDISFPAYYNTVCEGGLRAAEIYRFPVYAKIQKATDHVLCITSEGAHEPHGQKAGTGRHRQPDGQPRSSDYVEPNGLTYHDNQSNAGQSGGTTAGKAGIKTVIAAQGAAGHTTGLLDSRFEATWYASANQPTFIALARDRAQKGCLNPGFKSSAQIPKYVLEELGLDVEGSCKGLVGRGSKTEERAGYLHVGWESVGNQLPAGTGIGEGVDLGKGLLTRFEEVRARLSVEEGAVFQGKGGGQVSSVRLHIVGDGSPARLVMYS